MRWKTSLKVAVWLAAALAGTAALSTLIQHGSGVPSEKAAAGASRETQTAGPSMAGTLVCAGLEPVHAEDSIPGVALMSTDAFLKRFTEKTGCDISSWPAQLSR